MLKGHEPYPAVVVNRWWELVEANAGIALFTRHVRPELLEPPANVLRLSLHPDGQAQPPPARALSIPGVVVPLRYRGQDRELSFLSITSIVGTPMDVTVSELAIESFYPADTPTAAALGGS